MFMQLYEDKKERETMNETFSVFFDTVPADSDMEEIINRMDRVIEKEGWKYTGLLNMYSPIDELTRDETIHKVAEALKHTEWLKPYSPRIFIGNRVDKVRLENIDVSGMTAPPKKKLKRYEDYYNETKSVAHSIVIDEKGRIRDGYVSYLLAWKYSVNVEVLSSWSSQPVKKIVIGRHVRWDGEKYVEKSKKAYCWIYDLKDAVIPGDILLAHTKKGPDYMRVSRIEYITGKTVCTQYRKVKRNETAYLSAG